MSRHVLVIGAGIVGAACARELAGSGHRVTLVDAGPAAVGTSAAGEGNLLVSDKGPGAELELARLAARLWQDLAVELAAELGPGFPDLEYQRKGGVVVATTDTGAADLLAFAAGQRGAGLQARPVGPAELRELEPALTSEVTAAVHYPEDAQLQPVAATEALLASARRRGAVLRTSTAVTGALTDSDGRLTGVRTSAGPVTADDVVLAAGPWSGEVARRLGVDLPVLPRRGVVLVTARTSVPVRHKVYDADYVAAVGSGGEELQTSTVIESTAAGTVLIGSSREHVGFDPGQRVPVLRELAAKAVRLFPALGSVPVMRSYGGFRPFLPDHLPLVGADPRLPGLWHACGHEGAGIGLSVATGLLLRALVDGTPVPAGIDAEAFSCGRASLGLDLAAVA